MRGTIVTLTALLISAAFVLPAPAQNAQPEKIQTCTQQAREKRLRGAERKTFMSECRAARRASRPLTKQQQKMKDCNGQATEQKLKGADRRKFMSTCLKGPT
jgi:psiF repeat